MTSELVLQLSRGERVELDNGTIYNPEFVTRSRNGIIATMDAGETESVSSRGLIISDKKIIFEDTYPAGPGATAIREDGELAAFATRKPDDRIYFVHIPEKEEVWSHRNHSGYRDRNRRPPVSELQFSDETLDVFARGQLMYSLNFEGEYTEPYLREQKDFKALSEGEENAVQRLLDYLKSNQPARIIKALTEIELCLDKDIIIENGPHFLEETFEYIDDEQLHKLDLTDQNTPETSRKIMALAKKVALEMGKKKKKILSPWIDLLKTHISAQPEGARREDLIQLREMNEEWIDGEDVPEKGTSGDKICDVPGLQGEVDPDNLDEATRKQLTEALREEERARSGCGCLTFTLFLLIPSALLVWL